MHVATSRDRPPADFPAGIATDDIVARIINLGRRLSHRQYLLCTLLAEFDRSGGWIASGASSCGRWAADVLEVESGTAREWLRVGHALRGLPEVDAAFESGRLSYAKVRTLTRVAVDHPDRQSELIFLAEGSTAAQLPWELARWTGKEEDADERDRRHQREMALTVRTEPDGANVITIRLPPLDAAASMATIDALVMQRPTRRPSSTQSDEDAPADASGPRLVTGSTGSGTGTDGDGARPTLAKRRARAFIDVMTGGRRRSTPDDNTPGTTADAAVTGDGRAEIKVQTELIIHVRGDGNTFDDGTPVSGHLVEGLAPEAFFRMMIHDAERMPINVSGRHRHPSTRQKRVVAERDGHVCRTKGCDATSFLEYDHVPDFDISGQTVVDELQLICSKHHRARHDDDQAG